MKFIYYLIFFATSTVVSGCNSRPIPATPRTIPTGPHHNPRMGKAEIIDIMCARTASAAMGDYALAHHDHLPSANHWEEAIHPYWDKNIPFSLALSVPRGQKPHRLAMNKQLSGVDTTKMEHYSDTIMLYETVSDRRNASGDPASSPIRDPTDGHLFIRCFADGRPNFFDQPWIVPH